MRVLITSLILSAGFVGAHTQAAGIMPVDKVKTGILPSGGFYSLYEVTCHDQSVASVVGLKRGSRWCVSYQNDLSCYSRSQEASHMACAIPEVAATEEDLDALDALQ